jgi:carnitine O-acetyltransferase
VTFGNEEQLPRVPLPALEESGERFLEWCAPLLNPAELAETEAAVASFLAPDSPARTLHAALAEYDAGDGVHSWLDAFWASRYLGRRDRIALNANYFLLLRDSGQSQVERAAALVAAAVEYKRLLDAERIPPVVERGRPLSMAQHRFLFSTTRIPGPVQDTVRAPSGASPEGHIVVFRRGRMFRMDVVAPNGRPYMPAELAAGLRAVIAHAAAETAPRAPIGHLTTKPRAEWAESRRALLDLHPRNGDLLDTVETALFCLCLEETAPSDTLDACAQLLHGDSGNRWFDKALSLIVFADGTAGMNVEHSCLDGTTMVNLVDTMLELAREPGAETGNAPPFASLDFVTDAELEADVHAAAASFAAAAGDTATAVLSFDDFGVGPAKRLGISPDAFVHAAFQLAHRRSRGFVGATYESISTRLLRHGRTEAMRVVTPELERFVWAMDDPREDAETRRTALLAAAAKHVDRAKECQAGRAPEQHLWELQLIQRRRGRELGVTEPLALYNTPGWLKLRDDYLSTSSTHSANVRYGGFGPTGSRCIGIAYMLLPESVHLHLSAPRSLAGDLAGFADELRTAIPELQQLLSRAPRVARTASK